MYVHLYRHFVNRDFKTGRWRATLNQFDNPPLRVGMRFDVALGRRKRRMSSQELHVPQRPADGADLPGGAQGLEALRSYRTKWDEKARAFKKTPDHNWASHGADPWRYLSLSWRSPMREPEPRDRLCSPRRCELRLRPAADLERIVSKRAGTRGLWRMRLVGSGAAFLRLAQ
jgi:hypothetical protein